MNYINVLVNYIKSPRQCDSLRDYIIVFGNEEAKETSEKLNNFCPFHEEEKITSL